MPKDPPPSPPRFAWAYALAAAAIWALAAYSFWGPEPLTAPVAVAANCPR